MANERVIPIFPCASLKTTLEFYTALGFNILHEQHAPYVYGSVQLEGIQLDFVGSTALKVNQESSHTCLIAVSEIDALHARFSNGFKTLFGKQLRSGIPRMGGVNALSRDRRFNLLDPSGNRLIVIQVGKKTPRVPKGGTPLTRAITAAKLDTYSRDAPEIAAQYLDIALQHAESEGTPIQFQAFVLRADIAAMLGDYATLEKYVEAAQNLTLKETDLLEVSEDVARLRELRFER